MNLLGAILAGGRSSRFGSDKAQAVLEGATLLDHVVARLVPQCNALVICGRNHDALPSLVDRPGPDLGPLGGIAAALDHARGRWNAVVTVPCDAPDLPADLAARLMDGGLPAFVEGVPVVGLWLPADAPALIARLSAGGDRSMRGWIRTIGAVAVTLPEPIANFNRPEDLAAYTEAR